ncbi:MAG: PTS sugar transporter subunit IIA [Anaerococcus hydrogenalis]|uniref:PTS sugar transporter subunit IIA n=1 Tax=Anaerococcus hydrogenalis TaxID=33029 RepID=UPI002910349D|nr:PTS sugar transporter subunit IIA [Anaerococcus hydrogenalis]MDU3688165.1 PTS sugar transporter subunit IIA [Anaerococcus hydrogenalis]
MIENKIIKLKEGNLKNSKEVLSNLADCLIEEKMVKKSFKEAILQREKSYPTGLQFDGYGIALPHTDSEYVIKSQIAIMTLEKPVKFIEMASTDKEIDVKTIFMLALKDSNQHIKILQKVMELLQDKEAMSMIESFDDSKESLDKLIKLLEKYELN